MEQYRFLQYDKSNKTCTVISDQETIINSTRKFMKGRKQYTKAKEKEATNAAAMLETKTTIRPDANKSIVVSDDGAATTGVWLEERNKLEGQLKQLDDYCTDEDNSKKRNICQVRTLTPFPFL